jgi:hypothetical protein
MPKTIRIKTWPPRLCQACGSNHIYHKLDVSHEGEAEWCWCEDCKAEQIYWFQSCEEPS